MNITKQAFGQTRDGQPVDLYSLTNDHGAVVKITNYGGIITSLLVPDRAGKLGDVVLGFDTLAEYMDHSPFFGCLVGRYANRIAKGRFRLNGIEYTLAQNDGSNHLHGGRIGFDKVVWPVEELAGTDAVGLKLTYLSADGQEGYPGNLAVTVIYTFDNRPALKIDYAATTDQDTILNLSNHTYFNLAGSGDILGHEVRLNADHFTPVDETLIPTGELRRVAGTPLDFTQAQPIGSKIDQNDEQLHRGGGYDHNFVLNHAAGSLALAARVTEPNSGRILEVHTTQPGLQFYTGNMMTKMRGKEGQVYQKRAGFCLETQHFPDSPNQAHFPSVVLKPGEQFSQTTIFQLVS